MFGFIRRRLDHFATETFLENTPGWVQASTAQEMSAALVAHPVWRRVSADLREELVSRLAGASHRFRSFASERAFEIVVVTAHKFDVLHQNILPIDRNHAVTTPDKLWMIAEAFRALGSKGIQQALGSAGTVDALTIDRALTSCTMCMEAAVCVDHYRLDALAQRAWALALRARATDAAHARHTLEEGAQLAPLLGSTSFHSAGKFDESVRQNPAAMREILRLTRLELSRLGVEASGVVPGGDSGLDDDDDLADDDIEDDLDDGFDEEMDDDLSDPEDLGEDDCADDLDDDYGDGEPHSGAHPPEVEAALLELAAAGGQFDGVSFKLVADRVRTTILAQPEAYAAMIQRGTPVRRWVWGAISNAAGDLVESGEFHMYRGALDPTGPGDGLVRIFDAAVDEMLRLKAASPEFVAEQKARLRKNIRGVG